MEATTETQAVVQKVVATVVAPGTFGFTDCMALALGFVLMLVAALFPQAGREA